MINSRPRETAGNQSEIWESQTTKNEILWHENHLGHEQQTAPLAGHQSLVPIGPPSNDCVQERGHRQKVQAHLSPGASSMFRKGSWMCF